MNEFKLLSRDKVRKYLKEAEEKEVSTISRAEGGFTYEYLKSKKLDEDLIKKRNGFIKRTLPQYLINKTRRRYLSLIMWAYDPSEKI